MHTPITLDNIILRTDTYKLGHWDQYPQDTQAVFSYLEAREGAAHNETVFFGLQSILKTIAGRQVTAATINAASALADVHVKPGFLNRKGWEFISRECGGKLPVRIKAVPEGTVVPVGNVLMTVENTRPEAFWLTNALESLLLHVWYPTTVATLSRDVKLDLKAALEQTADSLDGLPFMLHDFGYRGVSSDESAAMGGMAHLVNFMGTDTLLGMVKALEDYDANLDSLAFSVPATEHSVMTIRGRAGEFEQVSRMIERNPDGIISVVADSFDIYQFVETLGTLFHERVMQRDGKFVVRPDSVPEKQSGQTPADLVVTLLERLWGYFGGTTTRKGYRVLDSHVGLLWGDGLSPAQIAEVTEKTVAAGFCASNLVFGMGGGLLQKVNRDTENFAFKASAADLGGTWHDVFKAPLGGSKPSKKGRLMLVKTLDGYTTINDQHINAREAIDRLETVFEDGELVNPTTFDAVRERAA